MPRDVGIDCESGGAVPTRGPCRETVTTRRVSYGSSVRVWKRNFLGQWKATEDLSTTKGSLGLPLKYAQPLASLCTSPKLCM